MITHEVATRSKQSMHERDQDLPEELQAYGALLTDLNSELIATTVMDIMALYPKLSLEAITKAMEK
jgi:hypothetical protein